MARIRIKHKNSKSIQAKKSLLAILAKHGVYATNIITANESFIILTHSDEDADLIFKEEVKNELASEEFLPIIPPEFNAKRSILLFSVDELIHCQDEASITAEIEEHNEWTANKIETVIKFNKSNTIKLIFKDIQVAKNALDKGIRMFNLNIPSHKIKQEEYIPLMTCMKCYQVEDHLTKDCPEDRDYMVCSECSSREHTWRDCKEAQKCCAICQGEHRTLSMKCPARKQAIKKKREQPKPEPTQERQGPTYSSTLKSHMTAQQPQLFSNEAPAKILTCMIHAHLLNIGTPGCYGQELNKLLKANGLPIITIPETPNSAKILNLPSMTKPSTETDTPSETTPTTSTQQESAKETPTDRPTGSKVVRGKDLGMEVYIPDTDEPKENICPKKLKEKIEGGKWKVTYTADYLEEAKFYSMLYGNKISLTDCFKKLDKSTLKKIRSGKKEERSPDKREKQARARKLSV